MLQTDYINVNEYPAITSRVQIHYTNRPHCQSNSRIDNSIPTLRGFHTKHPSPLSSDILKIYHKAPSRLYKSTSTTN